MNEGGEWVRLGENVARRAEAERCAGDALVGSPRCECGTGAPAMSPFLTGTILGWSDASRGASVPLESRSSIAR